MGMGAPAKYSGPGKPGPYKERGVEVRLRASLRFHKGKKQITHGYGAPAKCALRRIRSGERGFGMTTRIRGRIRDDNADKIQRAGQARPLQIRVLKRIGVRS